MFRTRVLFLLFVCLFVCWTKQSVDALINDRCYDNGAANDECKVKHAYCQRVNDKYGLCTCLKGYTTSRHERACLQVLGQTQCRSTSECDVTNAMCDAPTGRCVCNKPYVTSRDKTACVPPLGRSCADSSDCLAVVANTRCGGGVCTCRDQYLASLSHTTCLPVLGKRCMNDDECSVKDSYCDNGLCACRRNQRVASLNKTMCLPLVREILSACEEDVQCVNQQLGTDTFCLNKQCMCRYGNTRYDQSCEKRRVLDDWCNHTQQCQMITHASCVQNKCACDPYYVPHTPDRTRCVPIAIVYGSPCVEGVQCRAGFGPGGVCNSGSCECLEDHHFVVNHTGRCIPNRGIAKSCTRHDECYLPLDGPKQRVECANNVCACKPGLEPSHGDDSCSGSTSQLRSSSFTSFLFTIAAWKLLLLLLLR